MSTLITVPTFTFDQGDIFEGAEYPVQVCYYNGGKDSPLIELNQNGHSITFTTVNELKQLVKQIQKHLPDAQADLKK